MRFIAAWFLSVREDDWFYENPCTSYTYVYFSCGLKRPYVSETNLTINYLGPHGRKIHIAALSHFIDTFAAGFAFIVSHFIHLHFPTFAILHFHILYPPSPAPTPRPVWHSTCYKSVNNL